ncbi:hypothetical protein [Enterococcus viikkiensis]|uniref:hypothetical protein n=1 Tax=Enterococcus viikkiensis TaxID=930854 RepID=UPI0010F4C8AB|nr:hypothetical protein [Enterococcus viikkiensis]
MKRRLLIGLGMVFLTGCSAVKEPDAITVTSNDPVEVRKIIAEDQTESAKDNYSNRTYAEENQVKFDPQQDLTTLLLSYSWNDDSYIFTFKPGSKIRTTMFRGSKEQRWDTENFADYQVIDDTTVKYHISGNFRANVVNDYTLTVKRLAEGLQLEDATVNPPYRMELRPVKRLD